MRIPQLLTLLSITFILGVACRSDVAISKPEQIVLNKTQGDAQAIDIVEAYGQLFVDVQMAQIFEDSKTFVDMVPREPIDDILSAYAKTRTEPNFDLATFVKTRFEMPASATKDFESEASLNLDQHIERLWPYLQREAEDQTLGGTLIPLPKDYIVPGGRFREIYYWDSYFTMLGLISDGRVSDARRMVDNFAYLIDKFGFIPNGNRSYYLSRSQPPFFAGMVGLLAESQGDSVLLEYLPTLAREYSFWMDGLDSVIQAGDAFQHCARIKGDFLVNRYYDQLHRPRPEGFWEDSLLAKKSNRPVAELYMDLRSACESGWDFSSRWLADPQDLGSIRTTRLAPVDLNSLLYYLEDMLAKGYGINGDTQNQTRFAKASYERRRVILAKFYNEKQGYFFDYDLDAQAMSREKTLAGVYPLYFGIATDEQAKAAAEVIRRDFLKAGGLITTMHNTGQQWDAPNGWPPLQWMTIAGLRRYGHNELAREIARRWLLSGRKVYARTGKITEKYNTVDTTLLAGGGEYPNQDGFGWSNGVFARLMELYPDL